MYVCMYVIVAGNHHLTIADSSLRLGFQPSHRLWRRLKQQLLHKVVLLSFLIQEVWNWIPSTRDTRNLRPTEESSGEKFAIHVLRGGHFALITQLEPSASSLCAQMYWLLVQWYEFKTDNVSSYAVWNSKSTNKCQTICPSRRFFVL